MKRITIICGHYGSGKSEFSINFALQKKVDLLIDLDIINPYFRSRELSDLLNQHQIRVISSTLSNALGSDLPYLSSAMYLPFQNTTLKAVIDLGGDGAGAKIIRQLKDVIALEEIDLLVCVNVFRDSTSDALGILKMIDEIEGSSGMHVSGLINTSNLLRETTKEDILRGQNILLHVAKKTHLPLCYTAVPYFLMDDIQEYVSEIMPIQLYLRKHWL